MPSLAGQKREVIVEQMRAFRGGRRPATLMHQLAKGYTDAQIEAVAEFFARQPAAR
jgi:cytochrome c553